MATCDRDSVVFRAAEALGVKVRRSHCAGHVHYFPASSLRPWTETQEKGLRSAIEGTPDPYADRHVLWTTKKLVNRDYSQRTAAPGQGFRVYSQFAV